MLALFLSLVGQQVPAVGVSPLLAISIEPAETLRAVIWYPTSAAPRDTVLGLLSARVAYDAPLAEGPARYPLVLISHGTGGNEYGHLDLALELARAGMVVLSVRHPGDNFLEDTALGTDVQFYGRSHQVVLALDRLLASPRWGARLDAARIGFFGYSAGGYTGMSLLGARINFERLTRFCALNPAVPPYCTSGNSAVRLTGKYAAPRLEPRIRAAAVAAPGFSFLLDSISLKGIRTPLLVMRAEADDVVREPDNVGWLRKFVPSLEPVQTIPGGHYVFLAPCSPALASRAPDICMDGPGVDRVAIHSALNRDLVGFFERYLAR